MSDDTIENADDTHVVVNMDTGKTLGLIGYRHFKYADKVSGGESMKLIIRITDGQNADVQATTPWAPIVDLQYPYCRSTIVYNCRSRAVFLTN